MHDRALFDKLVSSLFTVDPARPVEEQLADYAADALCGRIGPDGKRLDPACPVGPIRAMVLSRPDEVDRICTVQWFREGEDRIVHRLCISQLPTGGWQRDPKAPSVNWHGSALAGYSLAMLVAQYAITPDPDILATIEKAVAALVAAQTTDRPNMANPANAGIRRLRCGGLWHVAWPLVSVATTTQSVPGGGVTITPSASPMFESDMFMPWAGSAIVWDDQTQTITATALGLVVAVLGDVKGAKAAFDKALDAYRYIIAERGCVPPYSDQSGMCAVLGKLPDLYCGVSESVGIAHLLLSVDGRVPGALQGWLRWAKDEGKRLGLGGPVPYLSLGGGSAIFPLALNPADKTDQRFNTGRTTYRRDEAVPNHSNRVEGARAELLVGT